MFIVIVKWGLITLLLVLSGMHLLFTPMYLDQLNFKGTIKIQRDGYGLPTLHVSTLEQYLYGLGTLLAEDRLFQTTFRTYAAQGRLSEFLGEKTLEFDRYMREVNLKGWADRRVERFRMENQTEYAIFEALTRGINDRVAKLTILPIEFYLTGAKWQNFTVNHIFYLAIQFEWAISMNIVDEYTRSALLANYTQQEIDWILPNKKENWAFQSIPIVSEEEIPERLRTANVRERLEKIKFNPLSVERTIELEIIEHLISFDATNCWAVSGNYTESGLPLLSNDPHLENIMPSQWYGLRVNLTTPEGKNYRFVGGMNPGNHQLYGKHSYLATGMSISHGDNQDLYRETVEGNKYLLNGEWRDLKVRNQTIFVKIGSSIREDIYEVKETHRGPIIHYIFGSLGSYSLQNDTLSLAWTGFNTQWQSFVKFNEIAFIDNLEDLTHFLQKGTKTFINANIMVITKDNHILMQQSGLHPIRRNIESGTYIKEGTTTQHDWIGILPPEDRLHIVDPPKGYIIHANNRVAEEGYYGGYLTRTIYTARADRLNEILLEQINSGRKINEDFAKKVLLDTVDVYCRQILPQIMNVVGDSGAILEKFDCDFRGDSHVPTIYQVFMYELYHLMKPFSPEKMSLISFHQMQQGIFNYIHFAFRGDTLKQQTMRAAWKKTFAHLQKHFDTKEIEKWVWGEFHVDTNRHIPFRNHPILSKIYNMRFPGKGNFHTPNVAKMEQLQFGNFETTHRANTRLIFGFGKGHRDWYVIDSGVSESIFSGHYSDQLQLIQRGQMIEAFPDRQEQAEEL